jgi:hypothetical protein
MSELANADTFRIMCNQTLDTEYTWSSEQLINIEWLCTKVRQIYSDTHTNKL